jgi:hypothetical protein
MGGGWNANRAMFLLFQVLRCQAVILLADDTCPTRPAWERPWMQAVARWGQVNYAPRFFDEQMRVSGTGTPDDPLISQSVTAQCTAFSATAIAYGGYYDPRFRGFGHGHAEHSRRLVRLGYGGTDKGADGREEPRWLLLRGDLEQAVPSTANPEEEERNCTLGQTLMPDERYRAPWASDDEMRQFRGEIGNALADGPGRFLIRPNAASMDRAEPSARPDILGRWFGRP